MLDYYSEDNSNKRPQTKTKLPIPCPHNLFLFLIMDLAHRSVLGGKNNNLLAGQEGVTHFTLSYKMTDIVLHTK